jgi:hypothetical protein
MSDYSTSLAELRATVLAACEREEEWPAKLAAGVYAALDFAVADPPAARALTIDGRVKDEGDVYRRMIAGFAEQLAELAPDDERLPATNDQATVGSIASIVADHVRSERLDRLGTIAPELVHLALLPYLGFDEAKRWTQETARNW